tara:strand:+ start:331 stop:648 length:318 start_codon:yes stop_codon:yes gene_type:complete
MTYSTTQNLNNKSKKNLLLKIGDKIGNTDFTIKKIVKSIVNFYTEDGRKRRLRTVFYFISNSNGQERVLNWKGKNINDSEMYHPTFSNHKYKTWEMINIDSVVSE